MFPAVNRQQPRSRREARAAREAAESLLPTEAGMPSGSAAPAPSAAVLPSDDPVVRGDAQAEPAALPDRLDFDAVITGPIAWAGQPEPAPVGVMPRHGVEERADDAAALFGGVSDDREWSADEAAAHTRESPTRTQNDPAGTAPKAERRWVKPTVVTLVLLVVLGGMVSAAYVLFQPQIDQLVNRLAPVDNDYPGEGTGQVAFTIVPGETGSDIATNLHKAGVTKSYDAFYSLLLRQMPEVEFQPGVFTLKKQMSAAAALASLQEEDNRRENAVVVPEGTSEADVFKVVSEQTRIPLAELESAAANPAEFGLPAEATTLEGFLFPATYTFSPGATAQDVITTMVDRMFQVLDDAGVAPVDRWNTIVLASIVQREAGLRDDYPKVARVFLNRLAQGWDLQSDATVAYGTGNTHRVETTDAERADASNPYNTYVHPGLPRGPISNPGDLAIDAVTHPADGPWMFFVTWNLQTGETVFSTTAAEHDAAVQMWQQWMKDNPGYE